jgi:hypothetical protein
MVEKMSSLLEIFNIKYCHEGFEEGNNFIHRKLFTFKMDFELKIQGIQGLI